MTTHGGHRYPAFVTTFDFAGEPVHLSIGIDPMTLQPVSLGIGAGAAGTDLDVISDQYARFISALLARGASLDELDGVMRRGGNGLGGLAPAIVNEIRAAVTAGASIALDVREAVGEVVADDEGGGP